MHELSIASEILENVIKSLPKGAEKVEKITIDLGKLLMINPEQLKFCLKLLSKDTICEGMKTEINFIPVKIKCKNKHVTSISPEIEFLDIAKRLKCSKCNAEFEIIEGRELVIKRIVVV